MTELQTKNAFKSLWIIWKLAGVPPPEKQSIIYYIYAFLVFLVSIGLFTLLTLFYLIFEANTNEFLQLLPFFLTLANANLRSIVVWISQKNLQRVESLLTNLDQSIRTSENLNRLRAAIHRSSIYFRVYFGVYVGYVTFSTAQSFFDGTMVVKSWFPFNINATREIFYAITFYQDLAVGYVVIRNISVDSFGPIYLMMLSAHIDILGNRIQQIGKLPEKSEHENYNELIECIKLHKIVMSTLNSLSLVLSKTVFIQFLTTATCSSLALVFLFYYNPNFGEIIPVAIFLMGILLETLPYCYFGNILMEQTDEFVNIIYNMNWVDQDIRFRKVLIIFMEMNQEKKVIMAGKLVPVNLTTFLNMLKFTYTLMTFFTQINNRD